MLYDLAPNSLGDPGDQKKKPEVLSVYVHTTIDSRLETSGSHLINTFHPKCSSLITLLSIVYLYCR